jgi:hypothetical protein
MFWIFYPVYPYLSLKRCAQDINLSLSFLICKMAKIIAFELNARESNRREGMPCTWAEVFHRCISLSTFTPPCFVISGNFHHGYFLFYEVFNDRMRPVTEY